MNKCTKTWTATCKSISMKDLTFIIYKLTTLLCAFITQLLILITVYAREKAKPLIYADNFFIKILLKSVNLSKKQRKKIDFKIP